jgi:hypothetical protein
MMLHPSTFDYLKPTDVQMDRMARMRLLFAQFTRTLDDELPDGPDKTYVIRHLREAAMWVNVTLTRAADGTPRT